MRETLEDDITGNLWRTKNCIELTQFLESRGKYELERSGSSMRLCRHLSCKYWAKNEHKIINNCLKWQKLYLERQQTFDCILCSHISELGIEPTLIRSALKRGIRLCLLLLDLSDFWVNSCNLKFLLLKDRWRHIGYHSPFILTVPV